MLVKPSTLLKIVLKNILAMHRKNQRKRPLYDAINKYGIENFTIETLEEVPIIN